MNHVEEPLPEQDIKSKSGHKHKHRHRHRKVSITEAYSEKCNYSEEQYTVSSQKQLDDERSGEIKDSNKKQRRRKKRHGQRQLSDNTTKIAQKDDQNQNNHDNEIPSSFPEGRTCDIIKLLETRVYPLDESSCSPNINLPYAARPDTAQRKISKKTTDAIRGAIGVQDGVHTFEVHFSDKPWGSHCAVGVCSSSVQLYCQGYSHMVGNSPNAWVWDIPSLTLYHDGQNRGMYPGPSGLEMPHIFRMTIDREKQQLSFNVGLGNNVVFKDLPDSSVVLYPVISMVYGLAEVTLKVISSDLFEKYAWLLQSASKDKKHTSCVYTKEIEGWNDEIKHDTAEQQTNIQLQHESDNGWATVMHEKEQSRENDSSEEWEKNNKALVVTDINGKCEDDVNASGHCLKENDDHENVILVNKTSDESQQQDACLNVEKKHDDHQVESSGEYRDENDKRSISEDEEEETDFDQDSVRVESFSEEDQYLFHVIHGWDNTYKGSLIQPYPNAPQICVPLPNLVNRIQGVRCRRGFSGRGIHTWIVRELIVYTPSVEPEHMAYYRNNVIIGVATNEQRKFNFGFDIGNIGNEIWGLQYPDLMVYHGKSVHKPKHSPENPHQINLEKYDLELTDGIEMVLNTVTHRLTFIHNGIVLTELQHVKGEKLYPFVMYVKDAYYPLELNYVEGPKEYFETIMQDLQENRDKQEVHHVRMLMKRSSSMRESGDTALIKDKYTWGCHSPETEMPNKNTACKAGIAVAAFPLGGSRHKVKFHVEGSKRGFCIGFVHHDYPLEPVIQDSLPYLGNDLLSWCWDIDNKCLIHACKKIARYPIDKAFNQEEVTAYTMTLDFSPLGNNTASFMAHLQGNNQQNLELGIAFIGLPAKVLPTVVMKGTTQKLRMEYVCGPWKGAENASAQVLDDKPGHHVKSEVCTVS